MWEVTDPSKAVWTESRYGRRGHGGRRGTLRWTDEGVVMAGWRESGAACRWQRTRMRTFYIPSLSQEIGEFFGGVIIAGAAVAVGIVTQKAVRRRLGVVNAN